MDLTPQDTGNDLQFDQETATYFQAAGRWARFISIVIFILIGLLIFLVLLVAIIPVGRDASIGTTGQDTSVGMQMLFLTAVLILMTFVVIQLYRFANRIREGIRRQDQELLNSGLLSLRNYFSISAIMSVLSLMFSIYNLFRYI